MPILSPALPATAYFDPGWYQKEENLLFKKLWQFFTLSSLVDKPNKFVTQKIFGIPIVLQNFNGQLKAFENICLHRQAPIQTERFGCRPLTCAYHGWNYGSDGTVAAIPFEKEYYAFSESEKKEICLRNFPLARIGNAVFINLDPNPIPIESQFSQAFLNSLTAATECFDNEIITATFHRQFNWKLIFENLRDGLHPSFLHRDTLYKNVKFRPAQVVNSGHPDTNLDPIEEMQTLFSKGGADERIDHMPVYPWHKQVERFGTDDVYYNWLAFPNLHIASGTGGYSFIIEHYVPQSPTSTDVNVYYLTAKRKKPYLSSKAVLFEHMVGAERVLSEDFDMLESIQNNFHPNMPSPNWGTFEADNHKISSWISEVVNGRFRL